MENIINIKILFVATISSITDNHGVMFVNSLNNLTNMFQDVSFLKDSISICINKCLPQKNLSHVEYHLKEILNGKNQFSQKSRKILEYVFEKKSLSIF